MIQSPTRILFFFKLLFALCFPEKFITFTWLRCCVCLVNYTLRINGETHGRIEGKQGLQQGDPPSLLLFVIPMEYLTCILKHVAAKPEFRYRFECKKLDLVSLCFASGQLLIFCKGKVLVIKYIMDAFHSITSLEANKSKSCLYARGWGSI